MPKGQGFSNSPLLSPLCFTPGLQLIEAQKGRYHEPEVILVPAASPAR